MFAVLWHYGLPFVVVKAISALYINSKSAVLVDENIYNPFEDSIGVLQGDVMASFLFIILVDYLIRKATSDLDSGVETHPRRSRQYPAEVLNDLDVADNIALLESTMARAHVQLTSTASAAHDLGLIISVFKKEYMTANCDPQPSLQIYGDSINHLTDFKYLGSKMASAASDLKRHKTFAWSDFRKLERLQRLPTTHLCESEVILHHLCDNFSWWILGFISRHGKHNQRFCHLLLQDYAWDKTTRLYIQQYYLFHDQHWAFCVLCKEAPARFP